jgi:hypothetical protein
MRWVLTEDHSHFPAQPWWLWISHLTYTPLHQAAPLWCLWWGAIATQKCKVSTSEGTCITVKKAWYIYIFIYLAVCLTTGPKPLPKWALHTVQCRASSFKREYPLLPLSSSISLLHLLPVHIHMCFKTSVPLRLQHSVIWYHAVWL